MTPLFIRKLDDKWKMNVVETMFNEPISFVKCHSFSVCVSVVPLNTLLLRFSNMSTYHVRLREEVGGEKIVFQNAQLDTSPKYFEIVAHKLLNIAV